MHLIKQLLQMVIFPPGLYVLLLMIAAWWMYRRKQKKAVVVTVLMAVFIWVLSMPVLADLFAKRLESGLAIPKDPKGDVIILLGGGAHWGAPDMTGIGTPQGEMMLRLVTAVRLQKDTALPVIVSGGPPWRRVSEAAIAARFMKDLDVPPEKIIIEPEAANSYENAVFSKAICAKRGYEKPILVTSAIHMKRSLLAFEKAGLKVTAYPAAFRTWKYPLETVDFLPDDTDLRDLLHEYLGLLYYRVAY